MSSVIWQQPIRTFREVDSNKKNGETLPFKGPPQPLGTQRNKDAVRCVRIQTMILCCKIQTHSFTLIPELWPPHVGTKFHHIQKFHQQVYDITEYWTTQLEINNLPVT